MAVKIVLTCFYNISWSFREERENINEKESANNLILVTVFLKHGTNVYYTGVNILT